MTERERECTREHSTLNVEHLAQWYLRLNGFMTINDFVLHPDHKPWSQKTDADIFGVRFPFRQEQDFEDDEPFLRQTKPYFIIGEITRGECKLNGPWTDAAKENVQYVLRALGAFEPERLEDIARSLYDRYNYEDAVCRTELVAFGKQKNPKYSDPLKPLMQIPFEAACRFFFRRFSQFVTMKKDHQHWDHAGQTLWNLSEAYWNSEDEFVKETLNVFGIATVSTAL